MIRHDNSRLGEELGADVAREHGVLPDNGSDDLPTGSGKRVSARKLTSGEPIVGEMLPIRPSDRFERVRDDAGQVWLVSSGSVQPCQE